ncbi:unnamed protein product [Rhizoctonia solani]|uniref:Uncharacterized protein n=1 Tax=Rhizoctonia solani TaxID=456999 RepID=A0A8H3H993_9AGAM|nr:unnamed protein product [Rhizoctonia solani]
MSSSPRQPRSGVSSPASGYSMLSGVSSIETIASSRHSQRSSLTRATVLRTPPPVHPEFTYADAQVELWTPDSLFLVHEFQLNKFSVLAERIQEARRQGLASGTARLQIVLSRKTEDIRNTLFVVYTCVASRHRTPLFDSDTLISTLKIASRYKYPDLRQYAIDELEKSHNLPAIRRIELSDAFSIPEWRISAFAALCRRAEPISVEEAEILGIRRFVDISRIRQEEGERNVIELVNREVGTHDLLNADGTVLQERFSDTAEYTLRYPRLPRCDCRAVRSGRANSDDSGNESQRRTRRHAGSTSEQQSSTSRRSAKPISVIPCQVHEIAPRIAAESQALYSQRNDLVARLGGLKRAVAATQTGRPGGSVEDSLMGTSTAAKLSFIKTSTLRFWIHEFQLVKFFRIAELIRQARNQGEITAGPERRVKVCIPGTESLRSADFRNTFRVIYSNVVSAPSSPGFDETTLISTLRVATHYQNPNLRSFAITQLQSGLILSPIYRIGLSDELSLPDWEIAAFTEFCRRPEPISQKEAKILGITRFAEIARIREAEQRRQYIGMIGQATVNLFLNTDGTVKRDKLQAVASESSPVDVI